MPDVTLTVDGKKVTAPAGTLLIEACKTVGIEVPSFCYYPGSFAAGRVPHVPGEDREDAEAANGMHATVVGEGMIVATETKKCDRHESRWSRFCSTIIRSIARYVMLAASANCRT